MSHANFVGYMELGTLALLLSYTPHAYFVGYTELGTLVLLLGYP